MDQENPTAGDSGASITDRLERYLSAEEPQSNDKPEPSETVEAKEPAQQKEPAEPAEKTEKPEGDESQEGQQSQLTTSDLAKVLGIDESMLDVDSDGNVSIKTKIDGKEGAAKFADVLRSHQLQGHADNRTRAVAEQEKALQVRMQEADRAVAARLEHADGIAQVAARELMREYQSIDWNSLRQADPGQYAALRSDFQARNAEIQGAVQQIQQTRAQQQQQHEQQRAVALAQEWEKLPTLIPEWKDQTVAGKEKDAIVKWALSVGYPQETLQSLGRSTALDIATFVKAMRYDQAQAGKAVMEAKVRAAPKIVKPGNSAPASAEQNIASLKQAVKKSSGNRDSVAAYLMAKGMA